MVTKWVGRMQSTLFFCVELFDTISCFSGRVGAEIYHLQEKFETFCAERVENQIISLQISVSPVVLEINHRTLPGQQMSAQR